MKRTIILLTLIAVSLSALSLNAKKIDENKYEKVIRDAPLPPKFTDDERHRELAMRRKRVANEIADNSMLIMLSADLKIYTNDVDYHYRQENNLYYLTALKQNYITFVMMKKGDNISEVLFIRKRNPKFETREGRMYSESDATRLSGLKTIIDASEQKAFLESVKNGKPFTSKDKSFKTSFVPRNVYLIMGGHREFGKENKFGASLKKTRAKTSVSVSVRNALPVFSKLRLTKSPYEIEIMQHSVDITKEAILRSMGMAGRAKWEYEVQAEVEYTFRRRNASWGFPSIVGCGSNATTLHYTESQGRVKRGDLILMDVGAEYDYYTADITRTFPVNGKFTKEQAEIYQIVYDAQEAAALKLKPGASVGEASFAAQQVIIDGLFRLGLITDKNSDQFRLWYMHGWGHWLGMNVHDVGSYQAALKKGMIITNEPGIYIREDALDYLSDTPENREFLAKVRPSFEKYKNIGVRIEDDMLITETGVEWMSKGLPRSIKDIENFMSEASKKTAEYAILSTF